MTMTPRFFSVLAVCSALCLGASGCQPQSSAFPLSLQTVHKLDPSNTTQMSFEEKGGEIFVSVTDKHGDGHIHQLSHEGVSKQQALEILQRKQNELATGQ